MQQVEVTGDIGKVLFPALCASCGARPAGTLSLSKMFRHTYTHTRSSARTEYRYQTVSIPFCQPCISAHESARRPVDPGVVRRLRNRYLITLLPYVIPAAIIIWLGGKFGPQEIAAITARDLADALIWGSVLFLLAIALWGVLSRALAGRHALIADYVRGPDDVVPENPNAYYVEFAHGPMGIHYVIPGAPTSILASVDFADEIFEIVASNRRRFTFQNATFADAFTAINAERIWDPNSPRARRTRWVSTIIIVLVLVVGLVLIFRDMIGS